MIEEWGFFILAGIIIPYFLITSLPKPFYVSAISATLLLVVVHSHRFMYISSFLECHICSGGSTVRCMWCYSLLGWPIMANGLKGRQIKTRSTFGIIYRITYSSQVCWQVPHLAMKPILPSFTTLPGILLPHCDSQKPFSLWPSAVSLALYWFISCPCSIQHGSSKISSTFQAHSGWSAWFWFLWASSIGASTTQLGTLTRQQSTCPASARAPKEITIRSWQWASDSRRSLTPRLKLNIGTLACSYGLKTLSMTSYQRSWVVLLPCSQRFLYLPAGTAFISPTTFVTVILSRLCRVGHPQSYHQMVL